MNSDRWNIGDEQKMILKMKSAKSKNGNTIKQTVWSHCVTHVQKMDADRKTFISNNVDEMETIFQNENDRVD